MAATPPPYAPQDAHEARRNARAQRRLWRDQARAQKAYYRSYWHGLRRPSFVGPLILLAIGIIALLMTTGRLDAAQFWGWYAHWWPVLLIGLGVLLLAEYFMDWNSPWAGRRSIGGLVWLVLFLIALGWISRNGRLVGPFGWEFDDNGNNFWSWMGPEHDSEIQIDQALPGPRTDLTVSNPRGDVTLSASSDGQLHVHAHEVVHTGSDSEAARIFPELKPKVTVSGSSAVIEVPPKNGSSVDLSIQIPAAAYATITAGNGDVTADGLSGVQVTASQGDVKLEDISGEALGHMSHGDFSAHNIQGRVVVDGRGDDVTLSAIQGNASVDGEFFGDIHLEQVAGPVHYRSSMTTLDVPHLAGELTLDKSDLSISRAAGPLRIVAKSKDVDLTQIAGDATIEDSDGDVSVVAASPVGNVQISDHTGDVVLTMPGNASFSVTGSTSADESIRTDFPLKISTEGGRQTLSGSVGHGGVQLHIDTDHGDLELRRGGDVTLAVPLPAQTSTAARHFRAPAGQKPVSTE